MCPRYGSLESLPLTESTELPECRVSVLLYLPNKVIMITIMMMMMICNDEKVTRETLRLSVTNSLGHLERSIELDIRPPIVAPFLVCINIF